MRVTVILMLLAFSACHISVNENDKGIEKISQIMKQQEQAWNDGDLEGFMKGYWQSDSLVFIGSRGITYGWQSTLDHYKKTYAEGDNMGTLKFENEIFKPIDNNTIWVAGKWKLIQTNDTLNGHYTLLWKRMDGKWKIVADHSS